MISQRSFFLNSNKSTGGTPSAMLIRQGVVVDHQDEKKADILIVDGQIAEVAPPSISSYPTDTQIIDASGLYVMPGGIDVHTPF